LSRKRGRVIYVQADRYLRVVGVGEVGPRFARVTLSRLFIFGLGLHAKLRDRADVDLDLPGHLFAGDWLDGLAEQIELRELPLYAKLSAMALTISTTPTLALPHCR
jgi:hypothetical protein